MPDNIQLWKTRRALIEQKKSPPAEAWISYGRELADSGNHTEALDFFKKAGTPESRNEILNIAGMAAAEGDYFLYTLACQTLGEPPDPDKLAALAASAQERGLLLYAEKALAALGKAPDPDPEAGEPAEPGEEPLEPAAPAAPASS